MWKAKITPKTNLLDVSQDEYIKKNLNYTFIVFLFPNSCKLAIDWENWKKKQA